MQNAGKAKVHRSLWVRVAVLALAVVTMSLFVGCGKDPVNKSGGNDVGYHPQYP